MKETVLTIICLKRGNYGHLTCNFMIIKWEILDNCQNQTFKDKSWPTKENGRISSALNGANI